MGNCQKDVSSEKDVIFQSIPHYQQNQDDDVFRKTNQSFLKGFNLRETGILGKSTLINHYYPLIQTPETQPHNKEIKTQTQIDDSSHKYTIEYIDGSKYIGDVDKSTLKPHGTGVFNHYNGDVYNGKFHQGLANGKGTYKHKKGITYIGDMSEDVKNGYGEEDYGNGEVYKGYFFNGVKNGRGKYQWSNSDYYDGEISNNKKHGLGALVIVGSETYTGNWIDDKRNGMGKVKYANGDVYEGSFVDNVRQGDGILTTKDFVYKGPFANDEMHGQGTETNSKTKSQITVNYRYGVRV